MNDQFYVGEPVEQVRSLYHDLILLHPQEGQIYKFVQEHFDILLNAYQSSDERVIPEITNYHPDLIGATLDQVFSKKISELEIENIVLDEYGFDSWDDVKSRGDFNITFERAVNALLTGNINELELIISYHPYIVRERSDFGHGAGVIHYLGSNGLEIWRQVVPKNAVEMLKFLLKSGANPDQENGIYGGSDLKSLIESSDHPFRAGVGEELLAVLGE